MFLLLTLCCFRCQSVLYQRAEENQSASLDITVWFVSDLKIKHDEKQKSWPLLAVKALHMNQGAYDNKEVNIEAKKLTQDVITGKLKKKIEAYARQEDCDNLQVLVDEVIRLMVEVDDESANKSQLSGQTKYDFNAAANKIQSHFRKHSAM